MKDIYIYIYLSNRMASGSVIANMKKFNKMTKNKGFMPRERKGLKYTM